VGKQHGVAGIDPHKNSATISVLDHRGGRYGCRSFPVTEDGLTELLQFLIDTELTIDRIGVEGSAFLGRPLALALSAAGYDVREVQANRTAERRSRRRRAKSDIDDAEAIARETLADANLPPAGKRQYRDHGWETLTTIRSWRSSLVQQRVRLLTEAEAVLTALPLRVREALPETSRVLPRLQALQAATAGLGSHLTTADEVKLERLYASLTDILNLTKRIKDLDQRIPAVLTDLGCTLTQICGVGVVTAMDLLAEIGDPRRFATEAQFARWCGTAPVPVSSGEGHGRPTRHRLDLGGNRVVNSLLHTIHVTQARVHAPAKAYLDRRVAEHKSKREARRCHKRQLANIIIRHMWNDANGLRNPTTTSHKITT